MRTCRVVSRDRLQPFRSQAWLAAVHEIEFCVRCEQYGDIQAAHRDEDKGMGRKTDDSLTAALCERCHYELGNGHHISRAERHSEMDRAVVRTLRELTRMGYVGVLK